MVSRLTAGEEFLLVDHGKPVARLVSVETSQTRTSGLHPANFTTKDGFDSSMQVAAERSETELKPRIAGLHAGDVIYISDDFDDPLPDEFWNFDEDFGLDP